jgi:hypothetical protein
MLGFFKTPEGIFPVFVPLTTSQKSEILNKPDNKKRRLRHIQAAGIHEVLRGTQASEDTFGE